MTNFSFLQKKPNSCFYIRRKPYCYVFISFLVQSIDIKGGLMSLLSTVKYMLFQIFRNQDTIK